MSKDKNCKRVCRRKSLTMLLRTIRIIQMIFPFFCDTFTTATIPFAFVFRLIICMSCLLTDFLFRCTNLSTTSVHVALCPRPASRHQFSAALCWCARQPCLSWPSPRRSRARFQGQGTHRSSTGARSAQSVLLTAGPQPRQQRPQQH